MVVPFLLVFYKIRTLLGIPATSAYIERFFSKTGYMIRPHWCTLAYQIAEDLFFSKENIRFVQNWSKKIKK